MDIIICTASGVEGNGNSHTLSSILKIVAYKDSIAYIINRFYKNICWWKFHLSCAGNHSSHTQSQWRVYHNINAASAFGNIKERLDRESIKEWWSRRRWQVYYSLSCCWRWWLYNTLYRHTHFDIYKGSLYSFYYIIIRPIINISGSVCLLSSFL